MKRFSLFLLAFMLLGSFLFAVTPEELKTQSGRATVNAWPDADTVLLFDWHHVSVNTDGTAVEKDDFYQKVLTEAGRRELRELTFFFNETYEKVEIPLLEVVKADGAVVPVDVAGNSKVQIEPSQMGANIYDPANKIFSVSIPELEIGDVVHVVAVQTIAKPRIPGVWSDIFVLQANTPMLHYEVAVDTPKEKPLGAIRLKDEVKGAVTFTKEEKDGRIFYRWVALDVPQIVPEPDMPPLYLCVQRLLVSTAKDWPEISRWYYKVSRPRLDAVTPEIRAKTAELIQGKNTPEEKIMALFQFVSQQIRYMGITAETEAPGYEPHDVSMTFNQRYGVCRDKAALLVSMLELAGLKAYPVLFMSGQPKDDEVPNANFNHAIAAVELTPDKYMLMDPTYETTTELFPSTMTNMSFLVAKPGGDVLRRSPLVPTAGNLLKISTTAEISPDGTLRGSSTLDFLGVNDQIYRDAFSRWPLDYRRQFFASQLRRSLGGAELESLSVFPEDVRDMTRGLSVRLTFRAENALASGAPVSLLEPPIFGTGFGAVNFVLGSVGLEERKFPMILFANCGVQENFTLTFPPTVKLASLPGGATITEPGVVNFKRSFESNKNIFSGNSYFSIDTVELTPYAYGKLKDALKRIEAAGEALPIVAPDFATAAKLGREAFAAADSILLDSATVVKTNDGKSYTRTDKVKRKVLTYAGVKSCSELKINYNPAWETVEVKARITAPDGSDQTLAPNEINRMDAPGAAAAPRYPAGKVLIASLPGVVPGGTIEYSITYTAKDLPFLHLAMSFAEDAPIISKSFTLEFPEKLLPRITELPKHVAYSEENQGGFRKLHWVARNVPQLPAEPGRPQPWLFAPSVLVSFGDYSSFSKELSDTLDAAAAEAPLASELAKKIAPVSMRVDARAIAIRDYVAKNIRAAGPGLNALPWSCFSAPDVTLQSGYGNSADRAILLGAMLKAVGVEYRFVAASNLGYAQIAARLLNRAPRNLFHEALVYLPGFDSYLNDTNEYANFGTLRLENMTALFLETGRLIQLRPGRKNDTMRHNVYHLRLHSDGSAELEGEQFFYGTLHESMKQSFAEMTPIQQRQFWESLAAGISQLAEFNGKKSAAFDTYPGKLAFRLKIPEYAVTSGKFMQFALPDFGALSGMVQTASSIRKTPLWRNTAAKTTAEYRVELPRGFRTVDLGQARLESGRVGSAHFYRYVTGEEDAFQIECGVTLPVEFVASLDYDRLTEVQKDVSDISASRIILQQD